jgi:hypothetical protein
MQNEVAITASDTISEYREHKKKIEELAAAARQSMQHSYSSLLTEAACLYADFRSEFGDVLDLPPSVKVFEIAVASNGDQSTPEPDGNGKKIGGLRRSLKAAIKNGDPIRIQSAVSALKALGVTVETPDLTPPAPSVDPEAARKIEETPFTVEG